MINSINLGIYSLLPLTIALLIAFKTRSAVFSLGIVLKWIPDFGPMKKAEFRALTTGKVIRDGGMPLINSDTEDLMVGDYDSNFILEFLIPIVILFGSIIGSLLWIESVLIVKSFMAAIAFQILMMSIRRRFKSIEQLTALII